MQSVYSTALTDWTFITEILNSIFTELSDSFRNILFA